MIHVLEDASPDPQQHATRGHCQRLHLTIRILRSKASAAAPIT
jgi:hypothetical protein